jgi:predicted nucleic acid-binding protein
VFLTLYPDERTCAIWANIVDRCRRSDKPIQTADAWIASAARQWDCPLVTTAHDRAARFNNSLSS